MEIKQHYAENWQNIVCLLQTNVKNSVWCQQPLDKSKVGDGWVNNYFKYPNRDFLAPYRGFVQEPFPGEALYAKPLNINEWYLHEFDKAIEAMGIEEYILFETYDCDTASYKRLYIYTLYIKQSDFEKIIKPQLQEQRAYDLNYLTKANDPERIILLGDEPIKARWLTEYWRIVGADNDEKRAWNTPNYEKLMETLKRHGVEP